MAEAQSTGGVASPGSTIILGSAKSGTTALFYAIRNALRSNGYQVEGLFEPAKPGDIKNYINGTADDVPLVKALLGPAFRRGMDIMSFSKRIVIYRDPRDNVVSRLVFMLPNFVDISEKEKIASLISVFEKKEQNPESISVLEMARQIGEICAQENLPERLRSNAVMPAMIKRDPDNRYFMMPYQDLVEGKFGPVSEYLGFKIYPDFEVDGQHSNVTRTKGAGDWKNWMLDEDIQFFATDVKDDMLLLGFDPAAEAAANKVIAPAICSEYVARQFATLEAKRRARKPARRQAAAAAAAAAAAQTV